MNESFRLYLPYTWYHPWNHWITWNSCTHF